MAKTYRIFKRSCRNWTEFARARKFTQRTGVSYEEARRLCDYWNSTLTPAQQRRGTKFEFTED